jgi:hypothetical protein
MSLIYSKPKKLAFGVAIRAYLLDKTLVTI